MFGGTPKPSVNSAEIGYWIGRACWGQGFAPEAVTRMARWLRRARARSIRGAVLTDNTASCRVLERCGFTRLGEAEYDFPARCDQARLSACAERRTLAAKRPVKTVLVSAVALVDGDGRVLLARRPCGASRWPGSGSFPAARSTPDEPPEAALIRELNEEIGIDVAEEPYLAPFTFASHRYLEIPICLMPLYVLPAHGRCDADGRAKARRWPG